MRTKLQRQTRYTWFTPAPAGEQIGCSAKLVRARIAAGSIEALKVAVHDAKRPEYRISQAALDAFNAARTTRP